ncbi:MAG: GlsB/YeaQ/YmgE family stress response membrane protein [Nostochopsis sp.]
MINLIAWVVLGLIAGAIAKAIYPGRQGGGIVATILLGIIGSLVGGSIFNLLSTGNLALTGATFSIPGLIVAIIGAIIAIFIWSLITRSSAV